MNRPTLEVAGIFRVHYGWMANRCRRERAALCRELLGQEAAQPATIPVSASAPGRRCPFCGGVVEVRPASRDLLGAAGDQEEFCGCR